VSNASRKPRHPLMYLVHGLASLKLTIVLLVLAMVLVFAGTLAQVDKGIYQVLGQYFRTFIAWIDVRYYLPRQFDTPLTIPFPGGWLIGSAMLVNLVAAHVVRFQLTWRKAGIQLIHAGLIILLLGELVTGLYADEGMMSIREGSSANYIEHVHRSELAVIEQRGDEDVVTVVPDTIVRRAAMNGEVLRDHRLPFDVRIDRYMRNCVIAAVAPMLNVPNSATVGVGRSWQAMPRPPVSGVDTKQNVDQPALYATFLKRDTGESLGTYLLSPGLGELIQPIELGETTYHVAYRFERTYKPYAVHLIDFRHDRYMGTDIPRNFASRVRLEDPQLNEQREVLIYMNHPLRHDGATFYQASFMPDDQGTVLQVVRNPGWLLPYISSAIISLGLVMQFVVGLRLMARKGSKP
jgi:hypothetical protein